ncbi:MAG: hypothetical protein ABIO70_01895 [Pseudomonadota bacterium]
MVPSDFRLDSVCVHLVERLEGARRSYFGRPDEAPEAFRRIAEELVAGAAAEAGEYVESAAYPALLKREVIETFLPRYTRLALEHNALERTRYGAWRNGDPIARAATIGAAVLVAALFSRFFPSVLAAVAWLGVLLVGLMPELRAAWFRRQYQRDLQAVVDDMARIHDNLELYQPRAQADLAQQPQAAPRAEASRTEQQAALRAARAVSKAKE